MKKTASTAVMTPRVRSCFIVASKRPEDNPIHGTSTRGEAVFMRPPTPIDAR
jgi:Neuraminidase (sialidase)